MRPLILTIAALLISGCVHLDAKPMNFTCGPLLDGHVETYRPSPLFAQIQRDAGYDDLSGKPLTVMRNASTDVVTADDALIGALAEKTKINSVDDTTQKVLLLSGGGSWGAFGAGYLRKLSIRDWDAVTGISTGSLQGLFVAAGDYDRMVTEYRISNEAEVAKPNSIIGLLRKGSQYDITPLRGKVFEYLLTGTSGELPFDRIVRPEAPALFVGMVEASSGDLKVVAVSAIVRKAYANGRPNTEQIGALANCIGGVTLASSSIPVRLTPVQIDGKTYLDGGVRSSVFEAGVALRLDTANKSAMIRTEADLYVLRNGPTIVFSDERARVNGPANVDIRPDIGRVGMRGYSTIVNQNELMSIAGLRLSYPKGRIKVMTADGFNHPQYPGACGPRPAAIFDPVFMNCLIGWGERKASRCRWIELETLSADMSIHRSRNEEPCHAFD